MADTVKSGGRLLTDEELRWLRKWMKSAEKTISS